MTEIAINLVEALPRASGRHRFVPALFWALTLSGYFFIVYGGCNWVAARQANVGTWYFDWERHIPFIPAMIVPYMSIDLFFFCSPFLCTDAAELRSHVKRILLAITIAGICFLLFPLQMGMTHPRVGGFFGSLFDLLGGFDKPYNLVPSLHIALLSILWPVYVRHTRGVVRWVVHVWFFLIAASTLFTFQHHVVDLIGGFLLGGLCIYLAPIERRITFGRNLRAARRYAFGSGVFLVCAWVFRPWGWVLIWPAISMAILTAAYSTLGPAVFGKSAGRLAWPCRALLAPFLGLTRVSALYLRRGSDAWCEISPGVWLGRRTSDAEARALIRLGISAVLDVTAEYSERPAMRQLAYLNIPILDLSPPAVRDLEEGAAFIESHASRGVYVHCALGYSRSVCFAAAWLLRSGRADSAEHAVETIRKLRPAIVIRPKLVQALHDYQATLGAHLQPAPPCT